MDVSMKTMEPSKFVSMASFLTFIHTLAFFSLEMFSFTDWLTWGLCVVGSTLLTLLLLLALELICILRQTQDRHRSDQIQLLFR